MVSTRFSVIMLIALASGCAHQRSDSKTGHAAEDLHGQWFVQHMYGDPDEIGLLMDDRPSMTLRPDGRLVMPDADEELMAARYTIDLRDQTLTYRIDQDYAVFRYQLVDGVLLLRPHEGSGPDQDAGDRRFVVELTREPQGHPRHHAIRNLLSGQPLISEIKQADDNLRLLLDAVLQARAAVGGWPKSLGGLALNGEVEIDQLFAPWTNRVVPEHFDGLSREQQDQWLSVYSSYVYLHGEMYGDDSALEGAGPHLILFELHRAEQADHIGFAYSNGEIRRVSRPEASIILKEHTGRSLRDWILIQS